MARSDGAVVIETRLNTEKIDTDFKKIDKQTKNMINRYNKSVDSIKSQEIALENVKKKLDSIVSSEKTPASVKAMETELNKLNKQFDIADKKLIANKEVVEQKKGEKQIQKSLGNTGEVARIGNEIQSVLRENEELKNTMISLDEKAAELEAKISEIKLDPNNSVEAQNLTQKIENMTSKLEESKKQTNELGNTIKNNLGIKAQLSGIDEGFDGIGKKVDKLKTRMTRLIGTVAVFSLIRSGLTSLRNSFTSLLKQNDTFKSSLNQIKANLMTAFAPIYNACLPAINSLMNSLSKLTGTIAVFVSGLFGTSLEDAKKQAEGLSKSLDSTAKSGEKASGSLASFDNLEVIADNSSSGGSVGGTSSNSGVDYSEELQYSQKLLDILNNIKNFVVENKELVIGMIAGITGALISLKLLGLDPIIGLGIGLIIAGIVTLVQGIVSFINDPSWENFGTILTGLTLILAGVAIAMLAVNAANPVAWIVLAIAAVTALAAIIIKYKDEIIAWLSKAATWIYNNVIKPIGDFFVGLWDGIKNIFSSVGNWFYTKVISPVVNFFSNMWNTLKNGAKNAWEGIKNIFSTVANFFKNIFTNAWEGVKKVFSTGGKIFDGIKEGIVTAFKTVVNAIITGINKVVSLPFNGLNKILDKIQGVSIAGIKPFKWITWRAPVPQIPKLATGTVIPPRSEFMAILGDQKRGVNIEAPLDTIVEAFNKALDNRNDSKGEVIIDNLTIIARMGDTDVSKTVVKGVRIAEKNMGKPLFVS
ncbi:MAG: hypothetical protein ACI4VH_07550 [Clostridia bacterium]